MLTEVKTAIANGRYELSELQEALAALMRKQFLFRKEDKSLYFMVEENLTFFEDWLYCLGANLVVKHEFGMIGVIPQQRLANLDISQTAVLLVLRAIYDKEMRAGNALNNEIAITGNHFITAYRGLTGRADVVRTKKAFEALTRPLLTKSIIRLGKVMDPETGLPDITIRPSIELVVTPDFADALLEKIQDQAGPGANNKITLHDDFNDEDTNMDEESADEIA